MTLTRGRFSDLFAMAEELGPYDFWPVLPPSRDPQLHVSRNDRVQPFHLIHGHDTVLVHFAGRGMVEFPDGPVRYHDLEPGDHVYLPAGLAYRLVPEGACLQLLIKAEDSGLEALLWFCDGCGQVLARVEVDTSAELAQRAYHRACSELNDDAVRRTCSNCGTVRDPIDLAPFRWLEIADQIEHLLEQPAPSE